MFKTEKNIIREIIAETEKVAFYMVGGSGSGKSFVREHILTDLLLLDCDELKKSHPDYDPTNPAELHSWSAEELRKLYHYTIGTGENFVYDGTGSNKKRYSNWIPAAQAAGYRTIVVWVRCDLDTALERNRMRGANGDREVPEDVVIRKHHQVAEAVDHLRELADWTLEVDNS
jgi:predicted ABC-type ATPase